MQQRRLQRSREQGLQIAPAIFRIGILAGDDFALLGHADLAVHAAGRLRQDGVVARAAAAPDTAAAAVEQAQRHARFTEGLHQRYLGLIERPDRGEEAAILVAVGVAEHHFLGLAEVARDGAADRVGKPAAHDGGRGFEVGN